MVRCNEPDDAVTVTGYVPGGVPACVGGGGGASAPAQASWKMATTASSAIEASAAVRRCRGTGHVLASKSSKTSASRPTTVAGNPGGTGRQASGGAALPAVVVMVNVVFAGLAPTVTDAGLKLHAERSGSPEHENVMAFSKVSARGDTVIVNVADCPLLIVALLGAAAIVKSSTAIMTVAGTLSATPSPTLKVKRSSPEN